ncbi:MAG TPA: helix-turn-helix domain-containing protein [Streptosporangiaceae bacterium]|nr:helix-turn-helix domain-containing protein [Streptosporangiaceae bacterium]
MHRIAILVTDNMPLFEIAVPCEVFGPREDFAAPWWYQARLCAGQYGPVRTAEGLRLDSGYGLDEVASADTVIVPACEDVQCDAPPELLDALRAAYNRGARIASICTGAFTLAAAGLLDGRPATTHWMHADEFARRWPRVHLDRDVLYTDDGQILTSAGSAAGLDLCLHLVRRDHGTRIANALARRMVMPPHRDGGQAQYVEQAVPESTAVSISAVQDWARAHLDQPLTVEELATRAAMSPRTFARHFKASTGTTPLQWLLAERVRRARELLETTDDTIDRIAVRCGFGSAQRLRTHFARASRVTPHAFRRTFRDSVTSAADTAAA